MAYNLCKNIDKKDLLFIALTLEFNGLLWTGDNKCRYRFKTAIKPF